MSWTRSAAASSATAFPTSTFRSSALSLARLVYAQCGGYEELMDDGARLLAMTAAVDKVIKELDFYKASARRPDFLEMLLSTYTTMKMHGVTLAMLAEAAKQMHEKEPGLGGKLSDLSKIYMEYEKLCADGTKDATEELTHLNDILDERFPHQHRLVRRRIH